MKDYIQDYLSQLEQSAFVAEDKTELYLLFSSCLEVSSPPPAPLSRARRATRRVQNGNVLLEAHRREFSRENEPAPCST